MGLTNVWLWGWYQEMYFLVYIREEQNTFQQIFAFHEKTSSPWFHGVDKGLVVGLVSGDGAADDPVTIVTSVTTGQNQPRWYHSITSKRTRCRCVTLCSVKVKAKVRNSAFASDDFEHIWEKHAVLFNKLYTSNMQCQSHSHFWF